MRLTPYHNHTPDPGSSFNRDLMLWATFAEGAGRQGQNIAGWFTPTGRNDLMAKGTNLYYSGIGGAGIRLIASSSQYIDTGRDTQYNFPNQPFAMSMWFRVATGSTTYCLLGHQGSGNNGGWGLFILSTGDIQIVLKQNSLTANAYIRQSASTNLGDGKWHHVSVSVTPSTASAAANTATIYVDGKIDQGSETQNSSTTCTAGSAENLRIGARATGNYLDGWISDVRVWRRRLSDVEHRLLFTTPYIGMLRPSWGKYFIAAAGGSNIKNIDGLAIANVKKVSGLAVGSMKKRSGLNNV